MSVLLGVDLGKKRVGLAVSDESGKIAQPLKTLQVRGLKDLAAQLQTLTTEYRVATIVAGLPKTLKGELGPAAQKVLKDVEWLKTQVPVEWVLWDERLTTAEVDRMLDDAGIRRDKRQDFRDALAAQRILQNYIDARQNGPGGTT